ncbi:MAG: hypothetical protein ABI867_39125 [Kofleriaceae bacterium]
MTRLLAVIAVVLAARHASAAPDPFAVYHSPGVRCDVRPVSAGCRAAERADWRAFLDDRLGPPFARVRSVRLVDLFHPDGAVRGGWAFRVVVPTAPARWKPSDLHITLGGISLDDPDSRYVRLDSLVVEVVIERIALKPGKYQLKATQGSATIFSLDLELQDGAPDGLDPATAKAADAAAANQPPFLVAALGSKPDCTPVPAPAGCSRAEATMWRELFNGTLANHPHATRFALQSRPDGAGAPIWHWHVYAVFPTSPANTGYDDLVIQLDGVKASSSPRYRQHGTDALIVELTLLADHVSAGKHQIRAVDRSGKVVFSKDVELVRDRIAAHALRARAYVDAGLLRRLKNTIVMTTSPASPGIRPPAIATMSHAPMPPPSARANFCGPVHRMVKLRAVFGSKS